MNKEKKKDDPFLDVNKVIRTFCFLDICLTTGLWCLYALKKIFFYFVLGIIPL